MTETIEISTITTENKIRVTSKEHLIDFTKKTTHVLVTFNNNFAQPLNFYAELFISDNNQTNGLVFDIPIQKGCTSCKLVFSTKQSDYDLKLITASAINN